MARVAPGIDVFCSDSLASYRHRRVGVLCHPASVTADLTHVVDRLIASGIRPTRLFGPEHGVRGEAQDMVGVDTEKDSRTAIPVTSLYGPTFDSLSPAARDLADVDVLLIDLQDVGSRHYTYIWTMGLALIEAARAGVAVVVLDRPNPLGGREEDIEGGAVEPGYDSFVGLGSIPVRHGLTMGEMARAIAAGMPWGPARFQKALDVDLTVVPCRGWSRDQWFEDTGLPWVLPSPNMPTSDTAFVYPGQCLLEGTNLSEGRGSTRPFEIAGAPFLDGYRLAAELASEDLPGVRFRPLSFTPTFHKHARSSCGGVQLHVTDRRVFRPYRTGIAFIAAAYRQAPEHFRWRSEAYEFVSQPIAIDLLNGTDRVRRAIEAHERSVDTIRGCADFEASFAVWRRPHLLYGVA